MKGNRKELLMCIRISDVSMVKPWPIHVPAAAVIHEWLALFIIVRCKSF